MNPFLRGFLAIVLGLVVGSCVNMGLIVLSPRVIPPPPGVNVSDVKSMSASIHLFEPKHFLFPFLAHALGTLCGAMVTSLVAARHRTALGLAIGALFLAGGVAASFMIPAPAWFIGVDLLFAYLPIAWLGTRVGSALRKDVVPAP